ncbi:MAG TPA: 3-oxoacyl-[acyl-carrier-protein] synthase III C-terminal domain-containing protein [Verrucomicrobiae bacterium]|nr:3-oxoacyl-[acyl-carrier-protein] synthase III C-terminal domain-containing protein [Verrucomicrobiae bacterium]
MPRILSVSHALPRHRYSQDEIRRAASSLFASLHEAPRLLRVFDNSRIESRQFMRPLEWFARPASAAERSRIYLEEGVELALQAARDCLESAGVAPEAVDRVIFVSSTGFATPTPDAYLINRLGMRPETRRSPLWGLGCAAGAAGISRAFEACRAFPDSYVLLVALECCSLTFVEGDLSKKNMVAAALFSDGAAAVLLGGDRVPGRGPGVVAASSHLFPDTYRMMGWDFVDDGMRLVLSPRLPALVRSRIPSLVASVKEEHGIGDFSFYVTHPGGARVMDAYSEALGLAPADLSLSEEVLRRHGNMSWVSVLLVLERWLAGDGAHGGYGLLSAFGPGFSAELVVLQEEA